MADELRIRDARPSDRGFLLEGLERNRAIEGRARPAATPADARETDDIIARGLVRVLERDGAPIAFLSFRLDKEVMYVDGRFLWVDLVYVHEDHRGRGLGRRLYEEAARLAKAHGCDKVVADVFASNRGSLAFHDQMGFAPLYTIFERPV